MHDVRSYPDLIIITLILHVFIKLFLWITLDPTHFQLLPHLQGIMANPS